MEAFVKLINCHSSPDKLGLISQNDVLQRHPIKAIDFNGNNPLANEIKKHGTRIIIN